MFFLIESSNKITSWLTNEIFFLKDIKFTSLILVPSMLIDPL